MNRNKLLIGFVILTIALFMLLPAAYTRPVRGCSTYNRGSDLCNSASYTQWKWAAGYNLTIGQFVAFSSAEMDLRKSSYGNIMSDTDTLPRIGKQLFIAAGVSALVSGGVWLVARRHSAKQVDKAE